MGIFKSFSGTLRLEITSADPARLITELNNSSVVLYDVVWKDPLTICGTLQRSDYSAVKGLAEKRGGQVRLLQRIGLYWNIGNFFRRPFLIFGILGIIALTLFLPSRVLFVRVEGNQAIPAKFILERAEDCGIVFGASRSDVRSEKMKNMLLSEIPQLQWAGINTSGCVATITVRERSVTDVQEQSQGVSSIVASRDGIIQEMTVTKGNPLCQVGQAVKAGQTLVSGYTDCGIAIKASQAEAEVYAQTRRSLKIASMSESKEKLQIINRSKSYYLLIGDSRIKLYGDAPIEERDGVFWEKTQQEHILTLPGDFALPVSLIIEEYICYEISLQSSDVDPESLVQHAKAYLLSQMVSGRIISAIHFQPENVDQNMVQAEFSCIEMIGKVQWENPIGSGSNSR